MSRIFISYRRSDSKATAGRIYDHLVREFGEAQVFKDVNTIPPGVDFRQYINEEIGKAEIVLVIIGNRWTQILKERSSDERDFVRIEIEGAITQGKRIIPVLVEAASPPSDSDLPESIRQLAFINVAHVDDDPDFGPHMKKLIQVIKRPPPKAKPKQNTGNRAWLAMLGLGLVLAALAVALWQFQIFKPPDDEVVIPTTDPDEYGTLVAFATAYSTTPSATAGPNLEVAIADGFDAPIGTEAERHGTQVWPEGWIDSSPYGQLLAVGTPSEAYHTGADLNFGVANEDKGLPVYAPASGTVVVAQRFPVWGNIIIIRHDPLYTADGQVVYSRLAHVGDMSVEAGQHVERGQQVTEVGDAFGTLAAHLHFDISTTTVLESLPNHWPGKNRSQLLANYVDPLAFIREHRPGGQVLVTPSVQTAECPSNRNDYFAGINALWHWKGDAVVEDSVESFAANIRANFPSVNAIFVKVADGDVWQGAFDRSNLAINSAEDVEVWVTTLRAYGLQFHAWAVPKGLDADAETRILGEVSRIDGVCSIILDIEPYQGFWQGSEADVGTYMVALRRKVGANFHIGISIDPRPQNYDLIFPDAWFAVANSIHPMAFWMTFRTSPEASLQQVYDTWGNYGLAIYPEFQGDAPIEEQYDAIALAQDNGATGFSWWRTGVISNGEAINSINTP